ncbi:MAG: rhodanese-like domain-containing protein [Bdellovibrionota bacterium]
MKRIALTLMLLISISAAAKSKKRPISREPGLRVITPVRDPFFVTLAEAESLSAKTKVHVIDVREEREFNELKVNSKLKVLFVPLSELSRGDGYKELLKSIPKGDLIVFICANGARAKLARDYVVAKGYDARFASLYKF